MTLETDVVILRSALASPFAQIMFAGCEKDRPGANGLRSRGNGTIFRTRSGCGFSAYGNFNPPALRLLDYRCDRRSAPNLDSLLLRAGEHGFIKHAARQA